MLYIQTEKPSFFHNPFNGLYLISCVLLFSWTQRTHISNLTLKTNYQGKACDFSIAGRSLSVELKRAKLLEIKLAIFLQNNILERWNWNQNLFCFAFSVIFALFWVAKNQIHIYIYIVFVGYNYLKTTQELRMLSRSLFKHCQRHNGPEGWVLITKVTYLCHIASS